MNRRASAAASNIQVPQFNNAVFARPQPTWRPGQDLELQLYDCSQETLTPVAGVSGPTQSGFQAVPEVMLYGTTRDGHSVLLRIMNFEPYLWVQAPDTWVEGRHEEPFVKHINDRLKERGIKTPNAVVRIETHRRRSLLFCFKDHDRNEKSFLKIVVQMPGNVPVVKNLFMNGFECEALWAGTRGYLTYESNVLFPLRFLVDRKLGGCNWVTVDGRCLVQPRSAVSNSQIELFVTDPEAVVGHEPTTDRHLAIAPFRILSFDIECLGRKGFFPEPEQDPIIQIGNYCSIYGSDTPLCQVVFTLGTCAPIAGAEVRSFRTEQEMLLAWQQFMVAVDPEILTGYNISNFDMMYLLKRAQTLGISGRFAHWSRHPQRLTEAKEKTFASKQMGQRNYFECNVDGRVALDMLVVMQRDYKLRSYSLNNVSQEFLGEQKEDVHHSIIADLQNGTDETRHRLAVYCLKDSKLPIRLMEKLMILVNNVEMARVTGVPIPWLLERGQQIKVFSQILRKASGRLLFPAQERHGGGAQDGVGYEGATVIQPEKGFYDTPIATLDFASLYPSLIQAHNLCYSTLIPKQERANFAEGEYTVSPTGDWFVSEDIFKGILPEILTDLLTARKAAKRAMNAEQDPLKKQVFNGRQLALKISANSVYGFTGAQNGKLPCIEISASVTSFGRQLIERTKQLVEANFEGAHVIYGDTDSVMVRCVVPENADDRGKLDAAMSFGPKAADFVTTHFKKPIKLEFEKVYFPYLLMNKKRYAGLYWTQPDKYDKMDAKGIELVRRDSCLLVSAMLSGVLNRILIQRSVESAKEYAKGIVSDLLMNRVDVSNLVVSKTLAATYANKQAHAELANRMRKRDPASAPNVGDRVAYVIVRGEKGSRAYENAEDPIYALENNLPIDYQYYVEHFLTGPLTRVFEAVMDDPTQLVKGDHTRHIAVAAPSGKKGGMMAGFIKIKKTCLGCRASVDDNVALCKTCEPRAADIYSSAVAKRNHFESIYSRVWTQCQQCQTSLHQQVLCSNRDCPVFYMRKKVEKDLKESQDTLDRFGIPVPDW